MNDAGDTVDCSTVSGTDTFGIGLAKTGTAGLTYTFTAGMTPIRGDNDWGVRITDTASAPVTGATLTVTPFMPAHQHGSPINVVVTEQADGTYDLNPVNLWMPGVWETTIKTVATSATDTVVFSFCVE
jgi:hypothetical protein